MSEERKTGNIIAVRNVGFHANTTFNASRYI